MGVQAWIPAGRVVNNEDVTSESDAPFLEIVNDRCQIRTQDGFRVVFVAAMPWAQYVVGRGSGLGPDRLGSHPQY